MRFLSPGSTTNGRFEKEGSFEREPIAGLGDVVLEALLAKPGAWLVMVATMLVDLDHLFAWPEVFVPGRCSIGFHRLRSYPAIAICVLALAVPQPRVVAVGLLFHMATDFQDCLWMR